MTGDSNTVSLRLTYQPPYDWPQVRDFLGTRAMPGVEHVDEQGYARTIATDTGPALVSVCPIAGEHALELRVRDAAASSLPQISAIAQRMFDLACDPAQLRTAFSSDPLLAPLLKARPGLRIPGAWDPFECAVRAVLGQQVSVAAARTLAARLVMRSGQPLADNFGGLTHLFPGPAELAKANLDGLGITGARIRALHALAQAVVSGAVDFTSGWKQLTASLAALPGFGEWTAQYIALRALGESDAFPAGDLVLRRMASDTGTPLTARQLHERAERWRPWRGYAVMHLWRAAAEMK